MDVPGSEASLAAVQQPVTGPLNVSPFPPAVHHPWWGIAVEAPWLGRAVSDTPALVAIRTHAECSIAGVLIPVDVTIIALAVPVAPDVPAAVGFDVDRSRVLRMPDGPLNPAVLDPSLVTEVGSPPRAEDHVPIDPYGREEEVPKMEGRQLSAEFRAEPRRRDCASSESALIHIWVRSPS